MALGDPYATKPEFKSYLEVEDTSDDARVTTALIASARDIEHYCRRQFNDSGSVGARQFQSVGRRRAIIDDFSTTAGLTVEVGSDSGTWTTWTINDDFRVGPVNANRAENPEAVYWRIFAINGGFFPANIDDEPNMRVNAQWGWGAVPENVKLANLIWGAKLFRRRDSPEGIHSGFAETPMRVSIFMDPDVKDLLADYRKHVPGMFGF